MANRFHINQEKGEIGACSAKPGNCPYASTDEHYDSMVDAAQAYEKSMESQMFPAQKVSKENYGSDLGLKLTPSSKFQTELYTSQADQAEVSQLNAEEAEIYHMVRNEVGPALTHSEARNMVQSWRLVKDKIRGISVDELRYQVTVKGSAHDYLAAKLTAEPGAYGKYAPAAELEANLTERVSDAINASRPYGFPEDEPARYRMDQRERGLLQAASQLSGVEPQEIKARAIDRAPVQRSHEGISDSELQKRQNHLSQLTRSTDAKRKELAQINREVAIRDVLASTGSETAAYDTAARYVKDRTLSAREIGGLIGTPRPESIAKLDGDSKRIWEQNWGR